MAEWCRGDGAATAAGRNNYGMPMWPCAALMSLVACGGQIGGRDDGAPDASADAFAHGDSLDFNGGAFEDRMNEAGEASDPTIVMSGAIVALSSQSSFPLSDAQACVAQTSNCSVTDGQGAFSLNVRADAQVAITIQRAGYTNVLVPIVTTEQDQVGWEIGTELASATTAKYANIGVTYPDISTAFLAAFASTADGQQGEEGATFQLTPSASGGPTYLDASYVADPGATSTSTTGLVIASFSSPVTTVTIVYLPNTLPCSPSFGGWPAPGANSVLVPLLAGFETHVGQECDP
jgi:hypothetical protein